MLSQILHTLKRIFYVDVSVSLEIEGSDTFAIEAQIDMALVYTLSENEVCYVWSDMWNCAIAIDDLEFSHVDTNNVAGYRIAGTGKLVWRDELFPVAFMYN